MVPAVPIGMANALDVARMSRQAGARYAHATKSKGKRPAPNARNSATPCCAKSTTTRSPRFSDLSCAATVRPALPRSKLWASKAMPRTWQRPSDNHCPDNRNRKYSFDSTPKKKGTAAEQCVPDSAQSTADNLYILLADDIGRWANSQFPGKSDSRI